MRVALVSDPAADPTQEAFDVTHDDGRTERMRIHEYGRVYDVPGLYEAVVQDALECASPRVLAESLVGAVRDAGEDPAALRAFDLGAGNGIVGEELRARGVSAPLVGLDPEPSAGPAAQRDRPGVYAAFHTATLDEVDVPAIVAEHDRNALIGAGALGIGHVSRAQIEAAWAAFGPGAWLAFTFADAVMSDDGGELREFVQALRDGEQATTVHRLERFRHRLTVAGGETFYHVLVARRAA